MLIGDLPEHLLLVSTNVPRVAGGEDRDVLEFAAAEPIEVAVGDHVAWDEAVERLQCVHVERSLARRGPRLIQECHDGAKVAGPEFAHTVGEATPKRIRTQAARREATPNGVYPQKRSRSMVGSFFQPAGDEDR